MSTDSGNRKYQALALGTSYALGTFNDNFFKQAGLLLAVTTGNAVFQSQVTFLFALPFVLFSAWSGWLADRFAKKSLVICAKTLELAAMLAGAWGMVTLDWNWMLAMTFCMGLSSTLFSPALNGSIPELFPVGQVPRINALFKLGTTASILFGVFLAGIALDQAWIETAYPFGRWLVAILAVTVAAGGLVSTAFIPAYPGAGSRNPFPWSAVIDSFRFLRSLRKDGPLHLVIWAEAFFYFLSTLLLLEINNLGGAELGLSYTATSFLPVALMVGICAGSLLAARGTPESWRTLLVPAIMGIGVLLCLVPFVAAADPALRLPLLFGLYALAGTCGGLYLIPITSFIQVRPAATDKGRILGLDNCLSFTGILLAGQLYLPLSLLRPSHGHVVLGILSLGVACVFLAVMRGFGRHQNPEEPFSEPVPATSSLPPVAHGPGFRALLAFVRGLLRLRYTIEVEGLEAVRARDDGRPILFLPNHPALIDPALVYTSLAGFAPRPLGDERQVEQPVIRTLTRLIGTISIPDLRREGRTAESGVREALERVAGVLRSGGNVLLYPAGGLTRTGRERLGGNRGVYSLRGLVPDVRLVLVRTTGLWGSSFSWARGTAPDILKGLARGVFELLLNGIFFMPRRRVRISVSEPELPGQADGLRTLNEALETFYNADMAPALAVPYHFLLGSTPKELPAPVMQTPDGAALADVPKAIRERVLAILREESGVEVIEDTATLATDLGIDSLSLINVSVRLEEISGQPIEQLEALRTVGDCILAAAGLLGAAGEAAEPPAAWFPTGEARTLSVPDGRNLVETAFRQAMRSPSRLMLADGAAALSARDMIMRAFVLASFIKAKAGNGERVGIMLPASAAAVLAWLGALMAGKTPVMCNWTSGAANFSHGLEAAGVRRVFTSSRLLDKLSGQGFPVGEHADVWVALEDAKRLSLPAKLGAFLKSRLLGIPCLGEAVIPRRVPETAAILFTSGSEALPKAVPLTHMNILANCRDIAAVLKITSHDSMLSMLPPFHSLGLTGNIALPLAFGLPAVYYANPTEGARLAALTRRWKPTITVAPPTFLDGMLRKARPGDLASLRLGFVGAEKCPDSVYAAFAEAAPGGVLCEGYGVTECSPVISVNRPESVLPGTIGQPLPSVRVAVVSAEGEPRRVAPGETGMLLVSGPNVFGGYLGVDADKQPFVAFEGMEWYSTGDLVSEAADGCLTFRGRLKRFVKVGGEMISLPQIESVLAAAFGEGRSEESGEQGPALAVESGEDGAIVLFTTLDITREEANAALRAARLSGLSAVARVQKLASIPVLGTGKTDYKALKTSCV